jgi:hypothetical protein
LFLSVFFLAGNPGEQCVDPRKNDADQSDQFKPDDERIQSGGGVGSLFFIFWRHGAISSSFMVFLKIHTVQQFS